jgi:hypothetical protein
MTLSHLITKLEHMENPDWHFSEKDYKIACAEALTAINKLKGDNQDDTDGACWAG